MSKKTEGVDESKMVGIWVCGFEHRKMLAMSVASFRRLYPEAKVLLFDDQFDKLGKYWTDKIKPDGVHPMTSVRTRMRSGGDELSNQFVQALTMLEKDTDLETFMLSDAGFIHLNKGWWDPSYPASVLVDSNRGEDASRATLVFDRLAIGVLDEQPRFSSLNETLEERIVYSLEDTFGAKSFECFEVSDHIVNIEASEDDPVGKFNRLQTDETIGVSFRSFVTSNAESQMAKVYSSLHEVGLFETPPPKVLAGA